MCMKKGPWILSVVWLAACGGQAAELNASDYAEGEAPIYYLNVAYHPQSGFIFAGNSTEQGSIFPHGKLPQRSFAVYNFGKQDAANFDENKLQKVLSALSRLDSTLTKDSIKVEFPEGEGKNEVLVKMKVKLTAHPQEAGNVPAAGEESEVGTAPDGEPVSGASTGDAAEDRPATSDEPVSGASTGDAAEDGITAGGDSKPEYEWITLEFGPDNSLLHNSDSLGSAKLFLYRVVYSALAKKDYREGDFFPKKSYQTVASGTSSSVGGYGRCSTLTRPQVESILASAGFPTDLNFIKAIYWESDGFKTCARGCNNSRCSNYDIGLLQINSANHPYCYARGIKDLLDPVQNARCAKIAVYNFIGKRGWFAWIDGLYRYVQCNATRCWKI